MVPVKKEDLRKMVTQKTLDTYEDLTPQLIQLIEVLAEILGIQED